ncbi:MAG TPA: ABC transporter substrate-binding protein [Dehalococcoidia bacterium]|jgi:ABC-type branched-subunit amino acid transport system substrate-binding protein|nr:ABC transporter substrate-binding protein [Dehalococcoidia bacterium]
MPQRFIGHRWLGIGVVALAGLLLTFAACGDDEKDTGGETTAATTAAAAGGGGPLKIGLLVDFTGALANYGPDMENAARLAIKHINAGGGVLGEPVELEVGDSATAPDPAKTEATRMIDVEKVHAIVGSLGSSVSLAVAESVTAPAKIPQISPASTGPALTGADDDDYLFRTPISDAAQGLVLAQLVQDLGFSTVCTMFVNNAYGQGLTEAFAEAFEGGGGAVSAQVSHPDQTAATSYSAELDQCVQGGPEALVAISYPTGQAEVYLREALEGGLIDQFVFVDGTKDDEMFAALGYENFDGMSGTAPGALPPSEFSQTFDDLYVEEYGTLYQVAFVRETYDAVLALALAAEKAGSTDGTAIRDALRDIGNAPGELVAEPPEGIGTALEAIRNGEDVDLSGASGSVEWDDSGDVLIGAIEVWTIDAATEKLVTERKFRVDLEAGEFEEIEVEAEATPTSTSGRMEMDVSTAGVMRLDPVELRGSRSLS